MPAAWSGWLEDDVRHSLTRASLQDLMKELARSAPPGRPYRVYLVGGGTAVSAGWRESTIDADLYCDHQEIFHDIQRIKERLQLNIEFVRPEDFVPALPGTGARHLFIENIGSVSFFHYDPYAQLLSKIVRGFRRDMLDAENFIAGRMVDAERFRALVGEIPESAYARYPALSRDAVVDAVEQFLSRGPS
jgi:hypothetical protein